MEKICVAIRVRPPTKPESQSAKGHKWRVGPHNVALYSTLGTPVNGQSYSFDHVYGTESKNADIYRGLTKDVIMSALSGFNGTVFAYGQTSSGKTYTMKGTPADPGIIRLAVHDVFSKIQEVASREFLIRVSYMEIYNEEINDLFAPENRRLQIHENLEKGIFVAGLREEIVDSPEQVFNLLEFGESHRHFGETNMNLYSSRSHTIFRMVIESRDMTQDGLEVDSNSDAVRVSALNLVDLAGSERIAKTGAGGVRLKEGTHINKSLMTLGTVINKLSEGPGKQGGHIPYRDSKLTRILQPALGGNAKTAMICTVTPDEIHIDETRGTLQFASRAKKVTNCAQVNEILTDAALLKRQTREIEDLRSKLQGLPQSEHLEKEILNLRNELLKYELEKERLFLELQEEKKAQIDRERRIKEQEQKIENLSTLFMSSNVDDRDNEKQAKKVNRRETWCPRQLNSDLSAQDFSWKLAGKHIEDEAMDNILYSMRRDRHFDLPPAFDTLVDDEAWNDSNAIEEPPPPTDFENIADEDTWMSLNKGHTTSSTVFTSSFFERSRSSGGNSEAEKLASLEADLKNLQEKYEDLRRNFDLKLQESTTELVLDVENSKKRLEKVLEENGSLRSDLRKMRSENAALTHELNAQLESQRRLRSAVEDVECEMDAARLLTSSLQGILVDSLHVQAVVVQNIQECFATSPPKGRVGNSAIDYKAKKVRERRALVENSVQKCRDICADVDVAVQNRLAQLNIGSERSLEAHAYDSGRQVMEKNPTHSVPDTRDAQTQAMFGPRNNGSDAQSSSPCELTYCGGCVSSALSAGNMHDFEQGSLSKEQNLKCECDLIAETHSRVMKLLRGSVGGNDYLSHVGRDRLTSVKCAVDMGFASFSPDCTEVDAKSSLPISTHKHSTPSVHQAGLDGEEPESIWRDFISCPHIGCSFGTLGRNCDRCGHQERAFIGENQIPLAMSNLCRHILKLLNPSLKLEDVRSEGGVRDVPVIEDINLKARLASAKVLTSWLFEELRSILAHDVHCLKSHVKERGSVGLLMEGLQVMLLENASLAIGLMQATCQDENSMNDLILRLQGLKDVFNTVPTVEAELTKAGMETEKHEQVRSSRVLPQLDDTKVLDCFSDPLFCQVGVEGTPSNVTKLTAAGPAPGKHSRSLESRQLQDRGMATKYIGPGGALENESTRALFLEQGIMGVESLNVNSCSMDLLGKDKSSTQATPGSSLDQASPVSVEACQEDGSLFTKLRDPGSDEQSSLIERLKMSREHIATLDRQLAVLYIEKDRIMKALVEELNGKEEIVTTTKLEKIRLAQSLKTFIGEVALHDEVLSAVCLGIHNFEKELEQRRPNHGESLSQTETPIQITQVAAPKEQTFSTISSMDASTKISPGAVPARVLKLEGVEEMLGELLQYSMLRLLNREQQMVKGSTLFIVLTVGLQPTSIFSDGPLQLQLCVENIKEIGSAGRSDHQSDSLKPGEMFRQQTSPGLQSGTCVAMTGAVRRVRTKKHEVTAADMQTWNIGGNCDQKQLEVSNCDEYPKAKTIQQFTWRTIDSEEKLRDQLLIEVERVKELERSLASSEMEVVELKIELEDLRSRMQMCEVTTQHGTEFQFELELEALKIQCENYEEEIRLILEQVPTVDDDLRRERKLIEVTEENVFLRNCLTKAEKRLARRKARRTTSTTTTHTRVSEENLKDEDVAVSFSRIHHAGSPVKVDGQTILSPVVNSVDRSRHGEICDQDLKVSGLLREVEMLREQLATQDIKPTPQKPSYSVVDAQAREYDGASKPDICKTDKGNITPHDFPRSVRSALGELEMNGRNANAACRNPKRRRQQSVNEYSSNKENLVNYR